MDLELIGNIHLRSTVDFEIIMSLFKLIQHTVLEPHSMNQNEVRVALWIYPKFG